MDPVDAPYGDMFPLTAEHRMLLRMRETLYEGSWEDFIRDLRARADNKPHVFDIVPASPAVAATIKSHLAMIAQMQEWEAKHQRDRHPDT